MAAGGKSSDESFMFVCSLCPDEGTEQEGIAYCTDCKQLLCHVCLKVHGKLPTTKNHRLLEGKDIHKVKKHITKQCPAQWCEKHSKEVLEFFCPSHGQVICELCRKFQHRQCSGVKDVADVSRGFSEGSQAVDFLTDAKTLMKKFKLLEGIVTKNLDHTKEQEKSCLETITTLREKINKLFDKLENDMLRKINKATEKESKAINECLSTLDSAIKHLEEDVASVEEISASGEDSELFIKMQRTDLPRMQQLYDDLDREKNRMSLVFEPDGRLKELLAGLQELGKLTVQRKEKQTTKPSRQVTAATHPMPRWTMRGKTIVFMKDQKLPEFTDKSRGYYWITGLQFLKDGRLVFLHRCPDTVFLINTNKPSQCSRIDLTDMPNDVAEISQDEVVVTTKQELQFYKTQPKLQLCRTVNIGRDCWGVAVHNNEMYVCCYDDPGKDEVLVLNTKGRRQRRIAVNQDKDYHATRPENIAVDSHGRLYISDWGRNTVTCLSPAGETLYTYSHSELQNPRGLLVDSEQNVCVSCERSYNINMISSDGRCLGITHRVEAGGPWSVAYRSTDNTLMLGLYEGNYLEVYKFQ